MAIKCVEDSSPLCIDYFTIEEYGVYIPEEIATSEVTEDGAKLQWNGNADSYNVRYRPRPYFLETFDGSIEDIKKWSVHNEGGNEKTHWVITSFGAGTNMTAHSGARMVMGRSLDYSAQQAYAVDNWLVSPMVPLGGILSYWLMDDGNKHEHYEIWVSTTVNLREAFEKVAEPGHGTLHYQWEEITVDLSKYEGKMGYIAFRLKDEGKDFLCLDDIALYAHDWKTVTTTEPNLVLTDLEPETTYDYQVQGVMDGETTEWSVVYSFTTPQSQANIDAIDVVPARTVEKDDAWYDLNGRKVNSQLSPVNSQLPKGIYIHNGRKILR